MEKLKKKEENERMIHIRLSDDLHRRLRIRAAELNVSIQRLVEKIIEKELRKQS